MGFNSGFKGLNTKRTSILTTQAYLPLLPFSVPFHNCTHLVTFSYQSPSYSSAAPTPILSYACTFLFPRVLFFYLEAVGKIPLQHYRLPIKLHGSTFQKTLIFNKINDSLWGTVPRGNVSAMTVKSLW